MIAGKGHENYQILKDRTIHLMMGKLFATSSGRETEHDQNRSHKKATQAKTLLPDSIDFIDVSTDSRSIGPGTLFVALRGEKFDGHDYVAAALEKELQPLS